MTQSIVKKISQEQIDQFLKTKEGSVRLLSLLDSHIHDARKQAKDTWDQIIDREEAASRWLNLLIILGLLQLFPINDSFESTSFLLITLPSFSLSVYSVALTLWKHPNFIRSDFFTPEKNDIQTRNNIALEEIKYQEKLLPILFSRYSKKGKCSKYIGLAILTNLSLCLIFLIYFKIFNFKFNNLFLPAIIGVISINVIIFLRKIFYKDSFSHTYILSQNEEHKTVK